MFSRFERAPLRLSNLYSRSSTPLAKNLNYTTQEHLPQLRTMSTAPTTKTYMNGFVGSDNPHVLDPAPLSKQRITLPDETSGYPLSAPFFFKQKVVAMTNFLEPAMGHPDQRSARLKLGLFLPATNTSMEPELYEMMFKTEANRKALEGVGIHTVPVLTAKPAVETAADVEEYGRQFVRGLLEGEGGGAVKMMMLSQPQYLIMGMSLEHVLHGRVVRK